MKRILILLLTVIFLFSCTHNLETDNKLIKDDTVDTVDYSVKYKVDEDLCELNNSKINIFKRSSIDTKILTYNDIDYISIEDATNLIYEIKKYLITIDCPNNIEEIKNKVFNVRDNTIEIRLKDSGDNFYFSLNTASSNGFATKRLYQIEPRDEVFRLNDFGVSYIYYQDTYYVPIMLFNICILELTPSIVPIKGEEYNYEVITLSEDNVYTYFDVCNTQHKNMTIESKTFTYKYIKYLFENYYPYYEERKDIIIDNLLDMYMNINKENYYFYIDLCKVFYNLKDGHTGYIQGLDNETKQLIIGDSDAYSYRDKLNPYIYEWISQREKLVSELQQFTSNYYKEIDDNIPYVYINSFMDKNIRLLNSMIEDKKAIIIDVRFNTGGMGDFNFEIMRLFFPNITDFYSKQRLNGKTYDLLKYQVERIKPIDKKDDLKIVVLTNRYSYSAANMLPFILKGLGYTVIGEKSGGGGSSIIFTVLPDGSPITLSDPKSSKINSLGETCEFGVEPTIYVEDDFSNGGDKVLESAIDYINGKLE